MGAPFGRAYIPPFQIETHEKTTSPKSASRYDLRFGPVLEGVSKSRFGSCCGSVALVDESAESVAPLQRLADGLEASEVVAAQEDIDVGERRLHAAGKRLVSRILFQRIEPHDAVREL